MRLVANKAQCLVCNGVVESCSTADYRTCGCGNLTVYGGLRCLRRQWRDGDLSWLELSET